MNNLKLENENIKDNGFFIMDTKNHTFLSEYTYYLTCFDSHILKSLTFKEKGIALGCIYTLPNAKDCVVVPTMEAIHNKAIEIYGKSYEGI